MTYIRLRHIILFLLMAVFVTPIRASIHTDYLLGGALTLKNGRIDKYQFDEGYCQAEKYPYNTRQDNFTFCYYDKDHLGNIRQVKEADGTKEGWLLQTMDYYPFGAQFCDGTTDSNVQSHKYNGKEFDQMHGLNTYDYGARQYNPVTGRWDRMDQLAEDNTNVSPYMYCAGNPVNLIDPDGRDWYSSLDSIGINNGQTIWKTQIHYTDCTSQSQLAENNINGTYLGKAVVLFDGYYNETLGNKDNMNSFDALLADVIVYGPNGATDVQQYKGYTMSSNPSRYGVVADGEYNVRRVNPLGPYGSPWAINNRGKVLELSNFNPRWPDRNPAYLTGVFIHRPNNNGWAGEYQKKDGSWHGVSEGCLLIHPNHWIKYNNQLKNVSNYHLILRRR